MRKLSLVLATAAGLAALAGVAAAPALAEIRFGINLGPPSYYQPNYGYYGYNGYNSYGYDNRTYSTPYYGYNQGYTYGNPNYYRNNRYNRYNYPGYYER